MKLAALLLTGFVVASGMAAAQQPNPVGYGTAGMEGVGSPASASDSQAKVVVLRPDACPVTMEARFGSATQMVKVGKTDKPNTQTPPDPRPSQRVHLILGTQNTSHIVSVRVTAYGLTARRRLDRSADPMVKGPSNISRTMDVVRFLTEKDGTLSADLVLPGFTAVKSVKLESITYADGSIHDFASRSVCSVPVNPMMLVADR